ncbi:MAG TPA: SMP-30/gluconolactonase/LRE family protein [Malonomonas sp.]
MKRTNICQLVLCFVLAALLGGCAAPKKQDVRILWPPPPAESKLEWLGIYSSELDLPRTGFQQSIDKLTGSLGEQNFISPFDIVSTASGRVYVSDIHLRNVRIYDFAAGKVTDLTTGTTFKTPTGMTLDKAENLYVTDAGHGKVMVFSPDGKYLRSFGDPENIQKPVNIVINDKLQRIFVADSLQHKIFVFDLQLNSLYSIGTPGSGEGELHVPQGMAFDSEDNLYVADYLNARVSVFTAEGKFVRMFGTRGDQIYNFEGPRDLAFDSEGNLHIVDARKGLLLTYSPQGQLLMTTGGGPEPLHPLSFGAPKGIYIDADDRIFIADQLNRRFSVFQFLSKKQLEKHPITEADLQRLMEFINQPAK